MKAIRATNTSGQRRVHKLLASAAILLFAVGTVADQAQAQSKPTVRKSRVAESAVSPKVVAAEDALEHKQFDKAEAALKQATTDDPKDYRAWFDLGFLYGATKRTPEAIDAYKKSVAAKPDVFESNLNLGLLLGDTAEAAQYLRAATKLKPQTNPQKELARAWYSLGHVLKDDPAAAADAFAESAKLDPTNPQPHLAAGHALAKKGDVPAAEREYQHAAQLDPKSKEPIEALANLYLTNKQPASAETALRKIIALDPSNPTAHVELSRVLLAENKLDEAAAETDAVLKLDPHNQDAQRQALAIALDRKQYPQVITQLRSLLAQTPNDAALQYQLGRALMFSKDFKAAQDELIKAIRLRPDNAEAYGDLAIVASDNQNYDLALKALDARAKLVPEVPATYFLRATLYDHLRQPKLAAENYHRFLEVANGKYPDEEWKARHRLIALEPKK
jgi:tetratricopeptide (TPR) repeat protein